MAAELSGADADAARAREGVLVARNQSAAAVDVELHNVLHAAHQTQTQLRGRLDAIERALDEGVSGAAGLTSPAAKRAFQQFLLDKQRQIVQVLQDAKSSAAGLTTQMTGVGGQYQSAGSSDDGASHVQLVDNKTRVQEPTPPQAGTPPDPRQWYVDDERFGHWEQVPAAPPYVGAAPPPLKPEVRRLPDGTPATVGPTTGMYTPNKTWIGDIDPPVVQGQEGYRFRLSGTEATTTTRMVNEDGHWVQQRWVQNTYEYQRNSAYQLGGDFGAVSPPPHLDMTWKPITIPQLANLSAANPTTTYYLPDGCGGTIQFNDASPGANPYGPPKPPVMTAPR